METGAMDFGHFRNEFLQALWPEFDVIEPALRIVDVAPGTVLLRPEDRLQHVWFPLAGSLSVIGSMPNGAQVQACAVGREGALGLVEALNDRVSGFTVACPVGARLSICTAEVFRSFHADSERVRVLTLQHAGDLAHALITEAACHGVHSVEARLCRWLLECDERADAANMRLTQEVLASLLGVQRTTVCQMMNGLQAAGLASTARGSIQLTNRPGLRRRACGCEPHAKTHLLEPTIGSERVSRVERELSTQAWTANRSRGFPPRRLGAS